MDERDADFLKKLLDTFKVEGGEHLEAISTSLLALEEGPSPEEAARLVETVFREAHSMKGAARSVNLAGIERVCQAMENVFVALQQGKLSVSPRLFDILHNGVNLLFTLLSGPPEAATERERVSEIVVDLNGMVSKGATEDDGTRNPVSCDLTEERLAVAPHLVAADTVRVSREKLDALLFQAEGFISVKQATAARASEAHAIGDAVTSLQKEWAVLSSEWKPPGTGQQRDDVFGDHAGRLLSLSQQAAGLSAWLDYDRRMSVLMVDNLLDTVKSVTLLPFSSLLDLMGKLVRDLASDQGKKVVLDVLGGEIEADRRVLDEMREPLIHLIRNSIDHGIEMPEERVARGKKESGRVAIRVGYREGQWIQVEVSDDGRGIDPAAVTGEAVRLGVMSPEEAGRLDTAGITDLLFRSGLSTSRIITDLSGRGLGLPIVRERVERIGGSIDCEGEEGKGATFRMLLPLSLATFRGLVVRAGDRRFVIPSTAVKRTLRVPAEGILRDSVVVDGRVVSVRKLDSLLQLPEEAGQREHRNILRMSRLVIIGSGDVQLALVVDKVIGEQEVLVKRMGPQLARVRNVLAATVLEDGEIVTILNVSDLVKSARSITPGPPVAAGEKEVSRRRRSVLVVEDSITSRSLLKNILEAAGYTVRTAVDGMDALAALGPGDFDLVVSDVDMPRMNGFELTRRIRSDKRWSSIPVVLVTSLQSREDQERGIEVGASAYIVKGSFDQSNLLETVRRLL